MVFDQINNENFQHNFPPMTDYEKRCMIKWGENDITKLNVISLVNVFIDDINNAEGVTYMDKIKSLDFTIVNNNICYNPFVQILSMFYLKQTLNSNEPQYNQKQHYFNTLIKKFWDELLVYLNISSE